MPFVIRNEDGTYKSARGWTARYSKGTPDLQKARVFKRRCDAANGGGTDKTIREVILTEIDEVLRVAGVNLSAEA